MPEDMHEVVPGLVYRSDFDFSYGRRVKACAYLVLLNSGNVLVGCCGTILNHTKFIRQLGGLSHMLLTHSHEASAELDKMRSVFAASVICHQQESALVDKYCTVDVGFRGEIVASEKITSIETPGHAPGSVCYLLDGGQQKVLFTGDTLYFSSGDWIVTYEEGSGATLAESLKKLKPLQIDWALPGIIVGDDDPDGRLRSSWAGIVEAAIDRVEAGGRH
jgi:glyoxylase-like metal-dependent hydrolase (beta-lactamase superfamily II)